jgi:hypothetical protein
VAPHIIFINSDAGIALSSQHDLTRGCVHESVVVDVSLIDHRPVQEQEFKPRLRRYCCQLRIRNDIQAFTHSMRVVGAIKEEYIGVAGPENQRAVRNDTLCPVASANEFEDGTRPS